MIPRRICICWNKEDASSSKCGILLDVFSLFQLLQASSTPASTFISVSGVDSSKDDPFKGRDPFGAANGEADPFGSEDPFKNTDDPFKGSKY